MVCITPLFPNCDFYKFVARVACVSDKPVKLSPAASVTNAMEISTDSQVTQLTASPQAGLPRSPSIDENSSELFLHRITCYALRLHAVDEVLQIPASSLLINVVPSDAGKLKPSGL